MNIKKIFSLHLLLCAALAVQSTHAFVIGDSGAITFTGNITASAFHKKSGTFVIGKTTHADDQRLVIYADPANGTDTQTLNTTDSDANAGRSVDLLNVSEAPTSGTVRAVYVKSNDQAVLNARDLAGTVVVTTATPIDAANGANGRIRAIATTGTKIFSAVQGAAANFTLATSGIATTTILDGDANTLTNGGNGTTFEIVNTINPIKGAAGGGSEPTLVENVATLHWCPGLSRLYLGIQGAATNNADGEVRTVLIFSENGNGLTSVPLFNNSHTTAFATGAAAATSNIVGASATNAAVSFATIRLDSMKTSSSEIPGSSTGHHYLIIQGGRLAAALQGNKFFAVPLVDSDGDVPGSLASVNPANGITTFKKTAVTAAELYTEDNAHAQVGGGVLPVAVAAGTVTGMMVVGDTVYVSTSVAPDAANEPGIYYSQAIYNADGSIASWTYWAKAVPNEVSGDAIGDGKCFTFAVDALTGKIWSVATDTPTVVKVTRWEKDTAAATLGGSVNALLQGPCYSQFNLSQHVPNYGVTNVNRFAFFGGDSKVVVVQTGIAGAAGVLGVEKPTTDWTAATATATDISKGLEGAGAITCFAWTNLDTGAADNYLLAGTNQGLYAYVSTAAGDGINLGAVLTNVDAAPFDGTYEWKKITTIGNDPVVKIVSMTGNAGPVTFVLTQGLQHKLWRISVEGFVTLATLDVAANIQTAWTADLISANSDAPSFFYDIEAIGLVNMAQLDSSTLVLETDKGLYIADDVGIIGHADAANIAFTRLVLSTETNEGRSLFAPQRATTNQDLTYTRNTLRNAAAAGWTPRVMSSIGTVNFVSDASIYTHVLKGDRIARENTIDDGANGLTLPLSYGIKKFYSDGARRFYLEEVVTDGNCGRTLHIVPYFNGANDYYVTEAANFDDAAINSAKTFYWINEMGAGYLMAGTDDGVVVLR